MTLRMIMNADHDVPGDGSGFIRDSDWWYFTKMSSVNPGRRKKWRLEK